MRESGRVPECHDEEKEEKKDGDGRNDACVKPEIIEKNSNRRINNRVIENRYNDIDTNEVGKGCVGISTQEVGARTIIHRHLFFLFKMTIFFLYKEKKNKYVYNIERGMWKKRCLLLGTMMILVGGFSPSIKTKVIIIPGMGGSSLYQFRETDNSKERVWPSPFGSRELGVEYNEQGKCILSDPRTGADRVGSIEGILSGDWMSRMMLGSTFYKPLIDVLRGEGNTEIHAIPYDFRRLLDMDYIEQLYREMEDFIKKDEESEYVVFCHSLGGLLFHDFLHSTTRDVHERVKDIIYINTPFDGSPIAVPFLLGMPITKKITLSKEISEKLRKFGGFYWCLPWKDMEMEIILHKDKTFRVSEFDELFQELGMSHEYNIYRKKIFPRKKSRLVAPPSGIRNHIFYSTAIHPTPILYTIQHKNIQEHQKDGDGVVTHQSILLPQSEWKNSDGSIKTFPGTDHSSILASGEFLQECKKILKHCRKN